MPEPEYRRLTRARNRSLFALVSSSRTSLWLGKDHLLQIDTSGYTENYKRFHFRDIQALVLCKTDAWLYRAVVLAALASFFGLLPRLGGGPVAAWIFGIIAGVFAIFLFFDLLAGPTAKCYLRTAVQTERLVALSRLRRARYVFEILRPLITAVQGEFKPEIPSRVVSEPVPPLVGAVPAAPEPIVPSTSPTANEPA